MILFDVIIASFLFEILPIWYARKINASRCIVVLFLYLIKILLS